MKLRNTGALCSSQGRMGTTILGLSCTYGAHALWSYPYVLHENSSRCTKTHRVALHHQYCNLWSSVENHHGFTPYLHCPPSFSRLAKSSHECGYNLQVAYLSSWLRVASVIQSHMKITPCLLDCSSVAAISAGLTSSHGKVSSPSKPQVGLFQASHKPHFLRANDLQAARQVSKLWNLDFRIR